MHVDGAGNASVEATWHAGDHRDTPVPTHGLISLGGTHVLVVALGDADLGTDDHLLDIDLSTGDATVLLSGDGAFVLGFGAFAPDSGLILVPDATEGVLRFRLEATGRLSPLGSVEISPCRGLPARAVGSL